MLFIIQNLPLSANITRIKQLIWDKCNISDVIVDNLIKLQNEGQATKQVTIGLADNNDAALFVKNINGLHIDGHQLYVEDVRQKKQSEYSHGPSPPQILNESVSHPPQHSLAMGRSMQIPPVSIPPIQMPVQFPMAYSNMPFYMTPVPPNSAQRNYVGNNMAAPLVNMSAQAPFYQQDSRFIPNKPNQNQNQWRAQAISYPILGFNQKMQEPMHEQIDVRHDSPRKQESNWRHRNEGLSQSASATNIWNSSQNFDVTQNNKSTRNERNIRQRSPRDRSLRDRSPRDRPSGDPSRDRPRREHSPRDRVLRRRSPRKRSRDRDYRRENDSQSRNRLSKEERSPPRSRRDGRDMRGRDDRLDNRQDERAQRPERPQRLERSQRPERPQRSERPQIPERPQRSERSENDNNHRDFDYRQPPCDVDHRINQNINNQKQDFTPNLPRSDHFQQYPVAYSNRSGNDNNHRDFDYRQPPCDVDQRINQNINYQQPELPNHELFQQNNSAVFSSNPNNSTFVQSNANIFKTQKSVFQLSKIASMYDPDPREPPFKKMRTTGIERPHVNKQFDKSIPVAKVFSKAQPTFGAHPLQEPEKSLSAKLLKQAKLITNAAKILSKQIISNANGGVIPDNPECLANLKKCITSRIDVVLGDCITNTLRDIIQAYREKFSEDDDPGFFKAVMDKIERDSKESLKSDDKEGEENFTPDIHPGPSNVNKLMPNHVGGKFKLRAAKRNANFNIEAAYKSYANSGKNDEEGHHLQNPRLNISKPSDTTKRLPSFPQGDKQVYKDQKKLQILELHEEIYTLEPTLKKALDDEMVLLCKEYTSACEEPTDDDKEQYNFHIKVKNQTLPEFKKIVQLHVTKRLLNIPNNLVIRIFAHPKPPKRDVIDEFLKNYDVASLRKREKKYQSFYLVTCASYKSYDEILKMGKFKVSDACTLQFRPMHLIGPKNNGNPAKLKRGKSNIPPENIIPLDEVEELLEESHMDMEDLENDEIEPNIDEDGNVNQEPDENQVNIDQDKDNNENLNENILDGNCDIDNEFTNDDFTCDEFANWNDKPRLDDSDVVLLEKEHDVVIIDDNDKKITETLDDENNDNGNETTNNDANEEVNETAENDGLDQNTNIVDEGTIEGVDVTEDDLEDF